MAVLQILCLLMCAFAAKGKINENRHAPPPVDVPVGSPVSPKLSNITQRVDHFNNTNKRTWTMRYLSNDECFKSGGPIVLYLGGEWSLSGDLGRLMSGAVYDIACENGGYMFYTEHRYYGKSFPTNDLSSDNLRYLSSGQALADIAYFIKYQKTNVAGLRNSSVVVIGGSYSGSLATWARIKYPSLVDIAYASSAPVRAKEDFYEYYEVVNDNLALASPSCPKLIKSAYSEIEALLKTEEGIANVSKLFKTCETVNVTKYSRAYFFRAINVFSDLVQYANPGDIESACSQMENSTGSNVEKLAAYVRSQYDDCVESYSDFLKQYSSTNIPNDVPRQWNYQTCTEFGWFHTTTSNKQPFGSTIPLDFFTQKCKDLFGMKFDEKVIRTGVARINRLYGADKPQISRLISVHGSVDPWHPMGILKDLHSTALAFYVQGSSHAADLSPSSNNDSKQMKETKLAVRRTIKKWLGEIRNGTSTENIL